MPETPWWKRVLALSPPFHDPNGQDGQTCWELLNHRLGIYRPGPKP